MRFWDDYPTITKIEGEEVVLKRPEHKEVVDTVKDLKEDEYLVVEDYKVLPYEFNYSSSFMKNGPELKIKKVDSPPLIHFKKELERYNSYKPKRGFGWRNSRTNNFVFISLSSVIDGAKLFHDKKEEIRVGGHGRKAWSTVPSRSEGVHTVFLDPLPEGSGKNWYDFYGGCDCSEHLYYKHFSKYVNPEDYICPHVIASYHRAMKVFPEKGEDPVPPLFPAPSKKLLSFDENLAKTFVKENYRRRLKKGERETLLSRYQGYYKNGLTFSPRWI